ncbi:MAG: hypothetical protein ACK5RF_11030 [Pirellula sp.]
MTVRRRLPALGDGEAVEIRGKVGFNWMFRKIHAHREGDKTGRFVYTSSAS